MKYKTEPFRKSTIRLLASNVRACADRRTSGGTSNRTDCLSGHSDFDGCSVLFCCHEQLCGVGLFFPELRILNEALFMKGKSSARPFSLTFTPTTGMGGAIESGIAVPKECRITVFQQNRDNSWVQLPLLYKCRS